MDCIFCKIVNGEIPCYKIFENDYVPAFLDIAGDVDGHTLVIPKKHFKNVLDCDEIYLSKIIEAIKIISNHYVNNCGYDGVNILNANNEEAQQSVFHLHFHIIPRKKDDNLDCFPHFKGATKNIEEMHKKLKIN